MINKYVIHACPQRMWYVDEFLVPSLQEQGIAGEDIIVGCDTSKEGCLENCMRLFANSTSPGGSWHLQDDVIICRDFKERTDRLGGMVCGFGWTNDTHINQVGLVKHYEMWWSFPCMRIPNKVARECAAWYYTEAKYQQRYAEWVREKKYDDSFFREFLRIFYPYAEVLTVKPSLVDHIDFLIGGTTVENQRTEEVHRARFFDDLNLVDELAEKIRQRGL